MIDDGPEPGVRIEFTLETVGLEVTQEAQLSPSGVELRISARSRSAKTGVVAVQFPIVPIDYSNGGSARGELVIPRGNLGTKCSDCRGFRGSYPSIYQTMPWFGALAEGAGLYVGAHDPDGRMKTATIVGPTGKGYSFFSSYPEESGAPGNAFDGTWPFLVSALCAERGWPALTHHYKQWVERETAWGRAAALKDRADIPQAVRDGALWFNYSISETTNVEKLLQRTIRDQSDFPDATLIHHWYGWHTPGMDRGLPRHVPKAGLPAVIKSAQNRDRSYVLLYLQPTHSDQSSAPVDSGRPPSCDPKASIYPALWTERVRRADGRAVFAKPSSGACLALMDLTSPAWLATVRENVDMILKRLGAAGVYLDVVGNVKEGSWAESEHHLRGRGAWASAAARDLVGGVARVADFVVVEGALEQMSGIADAAVNYLATTTDTVPLFPAVHHERFILAGLRSLPPDDHDALRVKIGLALAWGLHPGLMSLQWESPRKNENVGWLRSVHEAKLRYRDWLSYGEFLGPIDLEYPDGNESIRVNSWSEDHRKEAARAILRPRVEASLFRAGTRHAALLVNLGKHRTRVRLLLPPPIELGSLSASSGDESQDESVAVRVDESGIVSLPAGGIALVEIGQVPEVPTGQVGHGIDRRSDSGMLWP